MGWLKRLLGRQESEDMDFAPNPDNEVRRVTPAIGSEQEEQEMRARMERELEQQRAQLPRE